jgi:hypothetical protein
LCSYEVPYISKQRFRKEATITVTYDKELLCTLRNVKNDARNKAKKFDNCVSSDRISCRLLLLREIENDGGDR